MWAGLGASGAYAWPVWTLGTIHSVAGAEKTEKAEVQGRKQSEMRPKKRKKTRRDPEVRHDISQFGQQAVRGRAENEPPTKGKRDERKRRKENESEEIVTGFTVHKETSE